MMKRTDGAGASPLGILLPAVGAGLILTLLLMLLGAALVQRGTLGEGAVAPCALAFLALGAALAAGLSARRAPGGKFIWAMAAGALVLLLLVVGGAALLGQPVRLLRVLISVLCMLVGAALGGFAGASVRRKTRYKHIKR